MPQIGVGVSITLPYGRIGVSGGSSSGPPPPTHDLLWADGEGITWAARTIIDWPVI